MVRGRALRPLLAAILGLIVGNVVFFLVSIVANSVYPTPPELLDPQTPEETAARVDAAHAVGLVLVVFGSGVGGLAAGATVGKLAGSRAVAVAFLVGALLSIWGLYAFYVFYPARLWFPIGLFAGFLLLTPIGGLAVSRRRRRVSSAG